MKSFLEELYGHTTNGLSVCPPKHHTQEEEKRAYDILLQDLSDEQKNLFHNFLTIYADHLSDDAERMYYLGFKQGASLMMELFSDK